MANDNNEIENQNYRRNWSDLPMDTLGYVMAFLCFVDQICVRAVCKSWRRVRSVKPIDKFPWLVVCDDYSSEYHVVDKKYYLHNPFTQKTYKVRNKQLGHKLGFGNESCSFGYPFDFDSQLLTPSKSGWLLLRKKCRTCERSVIFLFNAFTQELINTPSTVRKHCDDESSVLYAFSFCPEWRCFVVYSVEKDNNNNFSQKMKKSSDSILTSMWRSGSEKWEIKEISLPDNRFLEKILKAMCIKGSLYCVLAVTDTGIESTVVTSCSWTLLVVNHNYDIHVRPPPMNMSMSMQKNNISSGFYFETIPIPYVALDLEAYECGEELLVLCQTGNVLGFDLTKARVSTAPRVLIRDDTTNRGEWVLFSYDVVVANRNSTAGCPKVHLAAMLSHEEVSSLRGLVASSQIRVFPSSVKMEYQIGSGKFSDVKPRYARFKYQEEASFYTSVGHNHEALQLVRLSPNFKVMWIEPLAT